MAFVPYALLLLQLYLLLSSISPTAYGNAPAPAPHHHHHHHHHHSPAPAPSPVYPPIKPPVHPPVKPPVHPPVKPPVHPPVKPPTKTPAHPPVKPPTKPPVHPPVKPPSYPPAKPPHMPPVRKLLAIQGVVYCKPCLYKGVNTLMKATPLAKAVVKLQCNNTKYGMVEQIQTDKNGYFLFKPQKVTTMAFHKCKVFLVSSPVKKCSVPTDLHAGVAGAILIPDPKPPVAMSLYQYFNVGPFAFDSPKKCY